MAWGHPSDNNIELHDAIRQLRTIYHTHPVVMDNAKVDCEVAATHLGLPLLPPRGVHDTTLLSFLVDSNSPQLSSKVLRMSSDERDDLTTWIFTHVPEAVSRPKTWTKWGAYISRTPGLLCGKYAVGEVRRTKKLFDLLHPQIAARGMESAYQRELDLIPVLLDMEQRGVPIDADRLEQDVARWTEWLAITDTWIRRRLPAGQSLDLDSNDQLADALERSGKVKGGLEHKSTIPRAHRAFATSTGCRRWDFQ
jgi:DNA polymerase I-like protein with 3'-5' exonuclease and polymerase domains